MSNNPNFLDLDAVAPETDLVVKLGGAEHKLVPVSVDDFVANTKALEAFQKRAPQDRKVEDEIELVIGMLIRAFPTMTRELLGKLDLPKLTKLSEFAQKFNGQKAVEDDAKGNPLAAG